MARDDYFHSPLRYPGGKRLQLAEILKRLDQKMPPGAPYTEACVGGGAVFWALAGMGRIVGRKVVLNDKNPAVVDFYRSVAKSHQSAPRQWLVQRRLLDKVAAGDEGLADEFIEIAYQHRRTDLNIMLDPRSTPSSGVLWLGLLFYMLNRTCMNGVVRMNKEGRFNVPIGKDSKGRPKRFTAADVERLLEAHYLCRRADIEVRKDHCAEVVARAPRGSVIYLDTPFSGGFTGYTKEGWSADDDIATFKASARADKKESRVVMSQPDTPWTRELCKKHLPTFKIDKIMAPRPVNRDGKGRQPVGEVLIWNKR